MLNTVFVAVMIGAPCMIGILILVKSFQSKTTFLGSMLIGFAVLQTVGLFWLVSNGLLADSKIEVWGAMALGGGAGLGVILAVWERGRSLTS